MQAGLCYLYPQLEIQTQHTLCIFITFLSKLWIETSKSYMTKYLNNKCFTVYHFLRFFWQCIHICNEIKTVAIGSLLNSFKYMIMFSDIKTSRLLQLYMLWVSLLYNYVMIRTFLQFWCQSTVIKWVNFTMITNKLKDILCTSWSPFS